MSYKSDVHIDHDALDIELLDQPSLILKYTRIQAQHKKEVDRLSDLLDLVVADLDKKIRENPEKFDIKVKITEAVITTTIKKQKKYKKAKQNLIDAQYENTCAKGTVTGLEHKKTSIELLIKLLVMSYFAGPNVPRDLSKEVLEAAERKRANSKINIKGNKKLKKRKRNRK